ncbi:auxin-responsive protein SAUR76 [Malania oleifera]|uniref:auxin-responsive protein SAUR76 n=1 Tax=Malania oleifera TaxID=397392 RepID=UPI0025AE1896|nr:auxin-responsive protein SAUR76 [Malania oleifera]
MIMKKKMNLILRKCRSLSLRQLGRSSSYSSLRSRSTKGEIWDDHDDNDDQNEHNNNSNNNNNNWESSSNNTIYVGRSRKRYVISSKLLNHPLLNALMDRSGDDISIRCEVVLFDHLLWMLQHSDPNLAASESLEELAQLYAL